MSGLRSGGEATLSERPRVPGGVLASAWARLRRWWSVGVGGPHAARWEAALDQTAAYSPGPAPLRFTCRAGTFLVTQEGDASDHPLEPGESFETAPRGKVVAWALRAGTLEVRAVPGLPGRR